MPVLKRPLLAGVFLSDFFDQAIRALENASARKIM
jgi:hypothetical protein